MRAVTAEVHMPLSNTEPAGGVGRRLRGRPLVGVERPPESADALFDAEGQHIVQLTAAPSQVAALLYAVPALLEERRDQLEPGDGFLLNDPAQGGAVHLPDVMLISPVFDACSRSDIMHSTIEAGIKDLSELVEEAQASEEFQEWLEIPSRFHDYSYRNTLLIRQEYPEATRVAGYKIVIGGVRLSRVERRERNLDLGADYYQAMSGV